MTKWDPDWVVKPGETLVECLYPVQLLMSDTPETLTLDEYIELLHSARHEVIVSNSEHARARSEFDRALDRYTDTREGWRAAKDRLDRIESFRPTPDPNVVARPV